MMRHNLPKIVSVLLLICMIFSFSVPYAAAAETASEYWTFIARDTEADAWRWEQMGIDIHDYVDGYVYAQDMDSKTIHLVLPKKTYSFWEVDSGVYCFTEAGEVIHVGYSGKSPTVVAAFQPDEAPTFSALFASDDMTTTGLYFADKEHVQFIDCANNKVTDCGYYQDIQSIRAVSEDEFFWVDSEDMGHLFNNVTAETEEMSIDEFENAVNYGIDTTALIKNYPNNSYSLGQYGAGKYFTKDGSACTSHKCCEPNSTSYCNCKFYALGIQCMGFAAYAYDQYSHRSYWQDIARDQNETSRSVRTPEDIRKIVKALPSSGIYLRFEDQHSLFIDNVSDTGISGYECNVGGLCKVQRFEYSYERVFALYGKNGNGIVNNTFSHHFSRTTATVVSGNAHKISCTSSGCNGYILEPHYLTPTTNPITGAESVCAACGYVGLIQLSWEEVEPYLSQNCKD